MATAIWQPLESNPESINQFLGKLGVESVECHDVWSFDADTLAILPKPQLAMLLCFPQYKKVDEIMAPVYEQLKSDGKGNVPADVFFMKQKISNACGTFALFHALANVEAVDLGSGAFKKFLDAAKPLSVDERSDLLAKDATIAGAHEATAQHGETAAPAQVEHHFICYVIKGGRLYEIDSRAPFPRDVGASTADTLIADAGAECTKLMSKLDNVSFSALALTGK